MSLLSQTIQEYLDDNHPAWIATPSMNRSAVFILAKNKPGSYIEIATTINSIIADNGCFVRYKEYAEHELLSQLTEAIGYIEQS